MGDKLPVFDWKAGEFAKDAQGRVKTATGAAAVEQIILKAQQTIRGAFLIYAADPEVPEIPGHIYGSDVDNVGRADLDDDIRLAEMERAVREAIVYDPYILAVRDIAINQEGGDLDEVFITATVDHIYGTIEDMTFTAGG